jgi:predicted metal-dependent HD superfamily phosphohydrolase
METASALVEKAATHVAQLFKEELSPNYIYHSLTHTHEMTQAAQKIAEGCGLEEEDLEILLLAAWFHDTGYIKAYRGHEEHSKKYARSFLEKEGCSDDTIQQVETLIESTRSGYEPQNLLQEIMHDADHIHVGKKSFFKKAELLRLEWELFLEEFYSNSEWEKNQLDYLMHTNFYTEYARCEYGEGRESNILSQREQITKLESKKEKNTDPKRGIETMYRTTYRNHINLSSIADSKANMMISINTIIMSVIITVVGGGFTLTQRAFVENLRFVLPIGVLLVGSLISVIFAVLSARPSVTEKKVNLEKIEKKKSSALFFGNFAYMQLSDFLKSMRALSQSKDLLYDNMSIDIYYLGQVLTRKYRLLRYSYNVFMGGLILAVVAFIAIFWYTQAHGEITLPRE